MLSEELLDVLLDRDLDDETDETELTEWASLLRNEKKRILVAEDDAEMCRLLVEGLRADGYDVLEAEDGAQLMDCIHSHRRTVLRGRFFDLDMIVSDIRMPGMTGLQVLSELRKFDRQTPVVLITAFGDQQTHLQAYRQGATAIFDKPFDLDGFRAFVRQLVPPDNGSLDGIRLGAPN